jgi:sulfate transport system permease protein
MPETIAELPPRAAPPGRGTHPHGSRETRPRAVARRRSPVARWLLFGAVAAYLALVLFAPLAALCARLVSLGIGDVLASVAQAEPLAALGRSLLLVLLALLINGVLGVLGAIVLVRHRFPGRELLDTLVDVPLAVSPVMVGLAYLLVFGRNGWAAPLLEPLGVRVAFAFPGLLLATLFVTLPFVVREVGYVLEELGTDEEQAARTLGASRWQTFRRITLPNVAGGLGYGLTLTAARALGEFGAVLVVGGAITGSTDTATTLIYAAVEERQTALAYGLAALLAAASMALLLVLERLNPHRREERGH